MRNSFVPLKSLAVSATSAPESWKEALAAIEQEQRRFVQYGVSQGELNLEIIRLSHRPEASSGDRRHAHERQTSRQEYWRGVDRDYVSTSPADDTALV